MKTKPSPLIQGRFEIPIKVKIIRSQKEKLLKFKYPMTGENNDDSNSVLNELGVHNDEDVDADNITHDDDDDIVGTPSPFIHPFFSLYGPK